MSEESWVKTSATVTTCKYQSPALGVLAFGFQTTKKFLITFDYYAHGKLYSDSFEFPVPVPQNTVIPITYNPLHPAQNSRTHRPSASSGTRRAPRATFAIGIVGSIVLSLLWVAILRGCR